VKGTTMPTRTQSPRITAALVPLPAREISIRLDEVFDTVAHVVRGGPPGGPGLLTPGDLVRCLAPYLSRN